jgi:DnaJ-class molecular chaperone
MSLTFDQMIHPDKHGLIVCSHCNGYGSSLKEEADRCTICGGTGLIPDNNKQITPKEAL